ncbi:MAG: hypothetical protein JRN37_04805 [Nitrososphaerota archaeon]|nr:hypothetical protein [Nitrososphaerota archaeon]
MKTKEDNSKGDDDLRVRESRYIRMVKAIFHVCRRQRIPVYSSKYSIYDIFNSLSSPAVSND